MRYVGHKSYERGKGEGPRTGVETPFVLEAFAPIATPDADLGPIHHGRRPRLDVQRIPRTGDGAKAGGRLVDRGCTGRLGDGLARGGRRRVVPLVGESPGVKGRELDCGQGVRGSKEWDESARERGPERGLPPKPNGTAQVPQEMKGEHDQTTICDYYMT